MALNQALRALLAAVAGCPQVGRFIDSESVVN